MSSILKQNPINSKEQLGHFVDIYRIYCSAQSFPPGLVTQRRTAVSLRLILQLAVLVMTGKTPGYEPPCD